MPRTTGMHGRDLIPVIDLFAGPGGLGEGFSRYHDGCGRATFRIALSIEKDESARRTLRLRSFLRQFPEGRLPEAYYQFLRGETTERELFGQYPEMATSADSEAWLAELGSSALSLSTVRERIAESLGNSKAWVLIGGPPCQAFSIAGGVWCRVPPYASAAALVAR
jgi:DNA (cytosine-5)-methyltransferase 1